MSKWLEAKKIKGKFYIDSSDFSNIVKEYSDKIDELEEENKKLKESLEKFSEAYKKYRDYEKEELAESCYDFARENEKLKEEIRGLRDKQYSHGEPTVSSGGVGGQIYIL